jgi:hypothetical protein
MPHVLNYKAFSVRPEHLPPNRTNLRLMLWAGDGLHGEVSDVKRLDAYDVYLCGGYTNLERNIADLSGSQTICIIDANDRTQMEEFLWGFGGAFRQIDADYFGNTPTLKMDYYPRLLAQDGMAHNIEGINALRMPDEEKLNFLEIFAPVLPNELAQKRLWHSFVLNLARQDGLSPGEVWSSGDFKYSFYDHIRKAHETFIIWQKERNPAWPMKGKTLEEHWAHLSTYVLTSPLTLQVAALVPYFDAFSGFLTEKIDSILHSKPQFTFKVEDFRAVCYGKEPLDIIKLKQHVLKILDTELPERVVGIIGNSLDERIPERPNAYGLSLFRV